MGKHLTVSQIGVGAADDDGTGDKGRAGAQIVNQNATDTQTAVNALAGRYWTKDNTARTLALGERIQSDDHAGIIHTLPATFVYDAEGLNDIWVLNHDDADNLTITPASGDEIYLNGASLGVDTSLTVTPAQLVIFSIRADSASWNAIVFTQQSASGSPLTTKGDLYGFGTADARIPVGTDGQHLEADSSQATGLKWVGNGALNNHQTGTSYTIQASDNGKNIIFENAAAIAVALPDGLDTNFHCTVWQAGAGVPTVTPNTDTINGAGTGVAPAAQWSGLYLNQFASTAWLAGGV